MQQAVAAVHLTQVALTGGKLGRADLERISRRQTLDISLGQLENPFFMRAGQVLGCNIFFFFREYPTRQYLGRADLTGGKPSRSEIGPRQTQIRSVPVRFSQMHQIKSDEYF